VLLLPQADAPKGGVRVLHFQRAVLPQMRGPMSASDEKAGGGREDALAEALRKVLAAHCPNSWDGKSEGPGHFCGTCTDARRILALYEEKADAQR